MSDDRERQDQPKKSILDRLTDSDPVGDAPTGDSPEYATDSALSGNTPEGGAQEGDTGGESGSGDAPSRDKS